MEVVGTAGAGAGGGDTSPEGRLAALVALGDRLARTPDLATRLVAFCDRRLRPAVRKPPPAWLPWPHWPMGI